MILHIDRKPTSLSLSQPQLQPRRHQRRLLQQPRPLQPLQQVQQPPQESLKMIQKHLSIHLLIHLLIDLIVIYFNLKR